MISAQRLCPKCGSEIPSDAPEGGCPGCLLQTALDATGSQVVFGRYKLVKVLGRGGMGIVWLARDEELERDVALKFLPDLIIHDAAVLSDLKRETKRCLELTHKNIVRIYDFVHDERSGCISMEYVDGGTLSSLRCDKGAKSL
jgi:serine/threonine protein kinase